MPTISSAARDPPRHRPGLARRQRPLEDDAIVAGEVVVGIGPRAVQVLAAGAVHRLEAERLVEADRDAVAGPRDRPDPDDATAADVVEEPAVELPAQAAPPPVRVGPDHVDVGRRWIVGADEADEEAHRPAGLRFGEPRRPGEVLEPEAREQRMDHLAAAPPFVDDRDDRAVVGLDGPPEAEVGASRPWRSSDGCRGHERGHGELDGDERALHLAEVVGQAEHAALESARRARCRRGPARSTRSRARRARPSDGRTIEPTSPADDSGHADEPDGDRQGSAEDVMTAAPTSAARSARCATRLPTGASVGRTVRAAAYRSEGGWSRTRPRSPGSGGADVRAARRIDRVALHRGQSYRLVAPHSAAR